jgi:hypothetical protein
MVTLLETIDAPRFYEQIKMDITTASEPQDT